MYEVFRRTVYYLLYFAYTVYTSTYNNSLTLKPYNINLIVKQRKYECGQNSWKVLQTQTIS